MTTSETTGSIPLVFSSSTSAFVRLCGCFRRRRGHRLSVGTKERDGTRLGLDLDRRLAVDSTIGEDLLEEVLALCVDVHRRTKETDLSHLQLQETLPDLRAVRLELLELAEGVRLDRIVGGELALRVFAHFHIFQVRVGVCAPTGLSRDTRVSV